MIFKKTMTLLLAALSLSFVSCIEEVKAPEDKASTIQEVQKALVQAWGNIEPLSMLKGDYVFQETLQTIESNPNPIFVLQEGVGILNLDDNSDPANRIYNYTYQTRTFKNGEKGPLSTRTDSRKVAKENPQLQSKAMAQYDTLESFADDYQMRLGFEKFLGLALSCQVTDELQEYCTKELGYDKCEIKCVNLRSEKKMVPAPDLVKAQPDCGGLANCQMQTEKVSFDYIAILTKGSNVEKQRVNYSITLSPDLPFLARVTEYCFRQLFPVQNQKILVNTCTFLKDFKKGTP